MKLTPIPRRRALGSIAAALGAGVAAVLHGPWHGGQAEAAQQARGLAPAPLPRDEAVALSAAGGSFELLLDGQVAGFFTECSGIGSENEVIEVREGGDAGEIVRKIPGRLKWGDVTLKRGIMRDLDIWTWRKQVEDGKVESARRSATILLLNQAREPVAKWHFEKAWPSKVTGPSFKSDDSSFATEEVTIAHEGMVRDK